MKRFNKTLLVALFVVALLALSLPLTYAQGDLSDDDLAQLDRVAAAIDAMEDADSFVSTLQTQSEQVLNITFGDTQQSIVDNNIVFAERTITLGDNPYGSAFYEVTATQDAGFGPATYTLEAEFRYVDGVLYGQAAYVESEGDVPPLPEGWFIVDDPFAYAFFDIVDVEGLLEEFDVMDEGEEEDDEFSTILPALRENATSVIVEEGEINEIPVEVVTIGYGWGAMLAILDAQDNAPPEDDPIFALFAEQLGDAGQVGIASFALDADDTVIGVAFEMTIELTEIDMGEIDPTAAGAIMDIIRISMVEAEIRSNVGETFEVPEVPEIEVAG